MLNGVFGKKSLCLLKCGRGEIDVLFLRLKQRLNCFYPKFHNFIRDSGLVKICICVGRKTMIKWQSQAARSNLISNAADVESDTWHAQGHRLCDERQDQKVCREDSRLSRCLNNIFPLVDIEFGVAPRFSCSSTLHKRN